MFLKKKKTGIEAVNPDDRDDKREAYRYIFRDGRRPSLTFLEKSTLLMNISAGGMAFKNNDFSLGDSDRIRLSMENTNSGETSILDTRTRIFHISPDGICHCSFENLAPDQAECIHKYVLEMQKKDLKS